ncbi:hypothetical protein JZU54_02475, partial [bacterium]|nr:hypothetical protein [bacterium]
DAGANSLILTGSNFSTLLESSESAATDIKGRLDWTKLSWDINGDDGTTTNVSFTLADIASAKVVNNSIMIIALTDAKAALASPKIWRGMPRPPMPKPTPS